MQTIGHTFCTIMTAIYNKKLQDILSVTPLVYASSHIRFICFDGLIYSIYFFNYLHYKRKIKLYDDVMKVDNRLKTMGFTSKYRWIFIIQASLIIFVAVLTVYEIVRATYLLNYIMSIVEATFYCEYYIYFYIRIWFDS